MIPFIFQYDNAPVHMINVQTRLDEHDVQVIQWFSQSPDLNVIENVWGMFQNRVIRDRPSTKLELVQCMFRAWTDITRWPYIHGGGHKFLLFYTHTHIYILYLCVRTRVRFRIYIQWHWLRTSTFLRSFETATSINLNINKLYMHQSKYKMLYTSYISIHIYVDLHMFLGYLSAMTRELDSLTDWFRANKLSLNYQKQIILYFQR